MAVVQIGPQRETKGSKYQRTANTAVETTLQKRKQVKPLGKLVTTAKVLTILSWCV